jgi:hypothetical protein
MSMEIFKVRLLNGVEAILVADEKPLYLNRGAVFYTVEDLIDGEKPYLQDNRGESIRPVIDWNNAVRLAAAKRVGRAKDSSSYAARANLRCVAAKRILKAEAINRTSRIDFSGWSEARPFDTGVCSR